MNYTITTGEGSLKFILERKSTRNMRIRVTGASQVVVSAPLRVRESNVIRFVEENIEKVYSNLESVNSRRLKYYPQKYTSGEKFYHLGQRSALKIVESNRFSAVWSDSTLLLHVRRGADRQSIKTLFERWSKRAAEAVFASRLCAITSDFPAKPDIRITVKNMLTRWGSINTTRNTMSLSVHLLRCETRLIDYIITHELCHIKHPDHSPAFYRELELRFPDRKMIDKMLEEYGLVDFW